MKLAVTTSFVFKEQSEQLPQHIALGEIAECVHIQRVCTATLEATPSSYSTCLAPQPPKILGMILIYHFSFACFCAIFASNQLQHFLLLNSETIHILTIRKRSDEK